MLVDFTREIIILLGVFLLQHLFIASKKASLCLLDKETSIKPHLYTSITIFILIFYQDGKNTKTIQALSLTLVRQLLKN